jgi:hypothetical protein
MTPGVDTVTDEGEPGFVAAVVVVVFMLGVGDVGASASWRAHAADSHARTRHESPMTENRRCREWPSIITPQLDGLSSSRARFFLRDSESLRADVSFQGAGKQT